MKSFSLIAAVAVALIAPAFSQDITSLPQCAQQPILEAISSSGCPLTDISCICGNEGFVNGLLELIPTLCTPDEVAVVTEFAETLCIAYGVTLSLPDVQSDTPSTASADSTTGASSDSVPATASATTTEATSSASETAAATTSETTAATTETTAATETTATSETASGTAADSAATTGAAPSNLIGLQALLGVAALGVAAVI